MTQRQSTAERACEDPVVSDETDWLAVCMAGSRMSPDDRTMLEARVAAQPDDLRARVQLLGYYFLKQGSTEGERRNTHILWLIDNHPEVDLGPRAEIDETVSPEAYADAARLWQAAMERDPSNTIILRIACDFVMLQNPALGEALLRRGQALEPAAPRWRESLGHLHIREARHERTEATRAALGREALDEYEAALALEAEPLARYALLIELADAAFVVADYARATTYADRVLAEADGFAGSWIYGNGIHHGHIVLGRVALVRGDVVGAKRHLAQAGATPGSPQLDSFGPDQDLAVELLARGERDAVIAYAESCKRFYCGGLGMIGAAYRKAD